MSFLLYVGKNILVARRPVILFMLFFALCMVVATVTASPVTIDTVSTNASTNNVTGSQTVFVTDQVGYTFYRDNTPNNGRCVYSKTTDGGLTWGTPVRVDGQTDCVKVVVWYDQWTPGGTGDYIHIVTMDTSSNALWYNRLDTSSDTRLLGESPVNITTNAGYSGGLTESANTHSMTVGTNGVIYAAVSDNSDSVIVSCSSSCNLTTSWNEVGSSGTLPNATDHNLLVPLVGDDVLLINRGVVSGSLRSRVWNGSTWGSWATIDSFVDNQTLFPGGISATLDPVTGVVYMAYVADHNDYSTADHDIRTARYSGGSWTAGADVLTNVSGRGMHNVGIALDTESGDVYVAYIIRNAIGTDTSAHVYWKRSSNSMSSWGSEQGPVSSVSGNLYGPYTNFFSDERIHLAWFNPSGNTRSGATIADIGPDVVVGSIGTPAHVVRSGFTGHLGGTFVISAKNNHTVSTVTITEQGTVNAGQTIENVALYYDLDTTAPYDCSSESFSGGEMQFGATSTNGFTSATSSVTFSNSPLAISGTQSICMYVVLTLTTATPDQRTVVLAITNPPQDIVSSVTATPSMSVSLATTTIVSPELTQVNYHWRNDDGNENDATSATAGIESAPLADVPKGTIRRIRMQVSSEGSTTSLPVSLRLEYALAASSCDVASAWSVISSTSDDWILADSSFLSDGADTTNISNTANGALTDATSVFVTPNAGVRDATNPVSPLTLATSSFVEVEFAIQAQPTASDGDTYCFRLTDDSEPLFSYLEYPEATIAADVFVSALGSARATSTVLDTNVWFGGSFVIAEQGVGRFVESLTITHTGSANASSSLSNVRLYYDEDTSAPYDCTSETYTGVEAQFGTVATNGFPSPNGSLTFNDSVAISTTSTLCIYVIADITAEATNSETVSFTITNPTSDVIVSGGGSVAPSTPVVPIGVTTLLGGVLTQTGYHWRNDDGSETGATSATGGVENTLLSEVGVNAHIRLRLGVANNGATTSVPQALQLEFGVRVTTCDLVSHWTPVDSPSGDDWDMATSSFVSHNGDTTNISLSSGGVSDGNFDFLATNEGIRTISASTEQFTLTNEEFTEFEFGLRSSLDTAFDTTYCFRLTRAGTPLPMYSVYPELTTAPKRDFKVQRGSVLISTSSATIVAGIDYEAPRFPGTAFIRITNAHHTGAGTDSGGGTQNPNTVTAYIQNPDNLSNFITFNRAAASGDSTYLNWEIVEFVGAAGTDNEMVVRSVGTVSMTGSQTIATGSVISVLQDAKVVVFVTGVRNSLTTRNYYANQVTSAWSAVVGAPVLTREVAANAQLEVSYAVVEYTGINWRVQRIEHTYDEADVTESASIVPVGSLARSFLHTQKRMGASDTVASIGQTVWLSSIGSLSLLLDTDADMSVAHRAVVWVVENTQIGSGAMEVQRLNGSTSGGSQPFVLSVALPSPIAALSNTSIFFVTRAAIANTAHPRAFAGARIASTTAMEIWRSNTGSALTYRAEIVSWPIANLALRQLQYRFYTDNNQITPDDPWPPGIAAIGENTSITRFDEPLGNGEVARVRLGIRVSNANMPADFTGFKLQFGERVTTCSAVAQWEALGSSTSTTIWRGYAATNTSDGTPLSTDPPTVGDILLSSSDRAGLLVHQNPATSNPYAIAEGQVVEYDWYLQQNEAEPSTTYCFRLVRDDDTPLSEYVVYPQIRTANFLPLALGWRWYADPELETPTVPLAGENVTPVNVTVGDTVALRIAVVETKAIAGVDTRFILQFSEDSQFTNPVDMTDIAECTGNSLWCYIQGGGDDNSMLTTSLLSDSDSCVSGSGDGCGTHHLSSAYLTGHTHPAEAVQEYSFTLKHDGARVNAVYYFRLYDLINDEPVPLALGATYPSIATESSALTFTITGLPVGTTSAGVTISATATPTSVDFGSVVPNGSETVAGQRLTISTNATQGYQVYKYAGQQLRNQQNVEIPPVLGTNEVPLSWAMGCEVISTACLGYHTTDPILAGGSTRFAATDSYAALHDELREVMFSQIPVSESHDIIYRLKVTPLQLPGLYETNVVYIAVPVH